MASIAALCFSLLGLAVMFLESYHLGKTVLYGISAVTLATICYSVSLVAVKYIDAGISAASTMTGALLICAPLFLGIWYFTGGSYPTVIPFKAAASIIYLGVVASVIGFMLFYYLLQRLHPTRLSSITLITPCCALILGNVLNSEPITARIITGTIMVLIGLFMFEFGVAIFRAPLFGKQEPLP